VRVARGVRARAGRPALLERAQGRQGGLSHRGTMTLPIALLAFAAAFAQGIDHAPFDALLRANVAKGVVNYPAFQDSAPFKAYVADLAKDIPLPTKADQLA